jgi:small subunit ribosomal protein S9
LAEAQVVTATGKRKTSVAQVRLTPGNGVLLVNGRTMEEYFPREVLQIVIKQPLEVANGIGRYDIHARVKGGGPSGQAGALRHSIARAIEKLEAEQRPGLKKAGLLTRDARKVERKKYGQRGARARFQFSKR